MSAGHYCRAPAAPGSSLLCPVTPVPGTPFCRKHARAPAGQRGGWLSADRRRLGLSTAAAPIDVSNVAPKLWVGAALPHDHDLPDFDMLVLCAEELQHHVGFHGQVVHCPLPDSQLSHHQLALAVRCSRAIATALTTKHRVLVTCAAGQNRSALVASLALAWVTRMSASDLVILMRRRRHPHALHNPHFVATLEHMVGAGRT